MSEISWPLTPSHLLRLGILRAAPPLAGPAGTLDSSAYSDGPPR